MENRHREIILASGSPRRRELMKALAWSFDVVTSDVDESPHDGESPRQMASRLAALKATAVAAGHSGAIVIAADTIVVLDGEVLGKPDSPTMAVRMLERLRSREHTVLTGLTVICLDAGFKMTEVASTPVIMRNYADSQISSYVATGDPMDKAGGYAIQSNAFQPVDRIDNCYANVMGLPLCHLYKNMVSIGSNTPVHPLVGCPYAKEHGGCIWAERILQSS